MTYAKSFFLSVFFILFFGASFFIWGSPSSKKNFTVKNMVVFGDSLSDQGNFFSILSSLPMVSEISLPSPPAGHEGKAFCDGKLLVEYIADKYHVSLKPAWEKYKFRAYNTSISSQELSNREIVSMSLKNLEKNFHPKKTLTVNKRLRFKKEMIPKQDLKIRRNHNKFFIKPTGNNYATSGATIEHYNKFFLDHFCLEDQVLNYMNRNTNDNIKNTLFIIFIGGNDIFQILQSLNSIDLNNIKTGKILKKIDTLAKKLVESVERLILFGAEKILILPSCVPSFIPCYYKTPVKVRVAAEVISRFYETFIEKQMALHFFKKKRVLLIPLMDHFEILSQKWSKEILHSAPLRIDYSIKDLFNYPPKPLKIKVSFNKGFNQKGFDNGLYPFFDSFHMSSASNKMLFDHISPEIDRFLSL